MIWRLIRNQSATDAFFAAPAATTPLAGTEEVLILQGQQAAQVALSDLMQGLVSSKGAVAAISGSRGSATSTVLGSLLTALAALGLITNSTTA